jgi:hypothetical protein
LNNGGACKHVSWGERSKPQNCGLPAKDAAKQLKVTTRSVETAKAVRNAAPDLAEEVKQGKTKLANAAKIVAKRSPPPSPAYARAAKRSKEVQRSNIEIKRRDDRMKSARYKLYRLFAIIPTWPNGSYRGNKNTAWSETCLIVCFILVQEFGLSKAEPLAHSMT